MNVPVSRLSRSRMGAALLLAAFGSIVSATHAATIVVNNAGDTISSGVCTLRAAVASINAAALQGGCTNTGGAFGSGDLITFDPSVTTIDLDDLPNNSFQITVPNLVINGAVTLRRVGVSANRFRIINHTGIGTLTLQRLTIEGGSTDANSAHGGGVYSASNLNLQNATVMFNETRGANSTGGGVFALGSVEVSNSVVSANRTLGSGSPGGGIRARFVETTNSVVASNQTLGLNGPGAGVYAGDGTALALRMLSTYLGDNLQLGGYTGVVAIGGAGAHAYGGAEIGNSVITLNRAEPGVGGGLYVIGPANISQSTFSENRATISGGAIYLATANGSYLIANSTIANNSTVNASPNVGSGGAIYSLGNLTLANSTLSGNATNGLGGAVFTNGGTLTLQSTLIANSSSASAASPAPNVDVHSNGPITATGANNLVRVVANVTMPAGTLTGDPLLGALQNNGCLQPVGGVAGACAPTMLLGAGSPAINSGNNALAALYDQRGSGFPRVIGGQADIGAIETATAGAVTWPITVSVSGPSGAGGGVSCAPNPVPNGGTANCIAGSPNAGYVFVGFSGACTGATCTLTNVTAAQSVTANYALAPSASASQSVPTLNISAALLLILALLGVGGRVAARRVDR